MVNESSNKGGSLIKILSKNFLFLFFFAIPFLHANDLEEPDLVNVQEVGSESLFVSLGSHCEIGHMLRANELRKAAFPFDWITTIDSERFLQILREDFKNFLNPLYLTVGSKGPGFLLNTYYHIEFLHEGDFRGNTYYPNFEKLQEKYGRRIQRFRELNSYKGKVFFLRTAFQYSTTDPHRHFFCEENLEISEEYAKELYSILKSYFPQLDFTLFIINNYGGIGVEEEKRLTDHLIFLRSNPNLPPLQKWHSYKEYFDLF